jgi:tetratricopeptide (TPR) repeat protein
VVESGGRTADALSRRLTDARRAAAGLMLAAQRNIASRRPAPPAPGPSDRHREAMRLNALGAKLRRSENGRWAAEQHRAALTIFEELGDRRSAALTLNNLALAVAHDGDLDTAIAHFEDAADILRGLDDTEHEARVIANLGFTYRRRGYDETATNLLQQALDKLSPASPDYRRVEQELRRAS